MAINMAKAYKSLGNENEFQTWAKNAKQWATPGSPIYNYVVSQGF